MSRTTLRITARLAAATLALSVVAIGAVRAEQSGPTYPYRPLPADKVPLPSLPEGPEPTLLPLKAARLALDGAPRSAQSQATTVVEPAGGGGCTGPRISRPARPACPSGGR